MNDNVSHREKQISKLSIISHEETEARNENVFVATTKRFQNHMYNNVLWAPLVCEAVILIFQFCRKRSPTVEGYKTTFSLDDKNLDDKNKEMIVEELNF